MARRMERRCWLRATMIHASFCCTRPSVGRRQPATQVSSGRRAAISPFRITTTSGLRGASELCFMRSWRNRVPTPQHRPEAERPMILRQSVILPVRNGAAFVGQAIASALSQLVEDDEIVVVDNGSTDDTISVVNGLADPRVRIVEEKRPGPAAA